MDPRLVKAQEDYIKALPYANYDVFDAVQQIPKLIKIIVALEKVNYALTQLIDSETMDPFDGKEEG